MAGHVTQACARCRRLRGSGDPVSVKTVRNTVRQLDSGNWLCGEIRRVEDDKVAAVAGWVVDVADVPAAALVRGAGCRHAEPRLARAARRVRGTESVLDNI